MYLKNNKIYSNLNLFKNLDINTLYAWDCETIASTYLKDQLYNIDKENNIDRF